jgi:hypothetical protein
MAIPTSGQIGVSQHLNRELGRGINDQFSIDTAENGGYGAINPFSRSRPNSANPAAFSEWYGYDHRAGGGPRVIPLPEIGYDRSNSDRACVNSVLGRLVEVWGDGPSLRDCTQLFSNDRGTVFADAGFYAEAFTAFWRYWSGAGFTQEGACRV